jgi:hypothetical protein
LDGDLKLRHRKAFELCLGVFGAIREGGANPAEPLLKSAKDETHEIASREIKKPRDGISLVEFFRDSMAMVAGAASEAATDFRPSDSGAMALGVLKRSVGPAYNPSAPLEELL